MGYPEDSSHIQKWILSAAEIEACRESKYRECISRIRDLDKNHELPVLSLKEENQMINWYCKMLLDYFDQLAADGKQISYKAKYTAGVFLRRFFLKKSLLEYDPAAIMGACVFVAAKIEGDHFIPLEYVSLYFRDFISLELPLVAGLEFNLLVISPRYAIRSLGDLYKGYIKTLEEELQVSELTETVISSEKSVLEISLSDIILQLTPSEIAVSLFLFLGSSRKLRHLESFVTAYLAQQFLQENPSLNKSAAEISTAIWERCKLLQSEWQQVTLLRNKDEDTAMLKAFSATAKKCRKLLANNGAVKRKREVEVVKEEVVKRENAL